MGNPPRTIDVRKRLVSQELNDQHDIMLCGHFHQRLLTRRVMVNGSLKGL